MMSQADKERIAANLRAMTLGAVQGIRSMPLVMMRSDLDDSDAIEYKDLYPEWQVGKKYRTDDVFRHDEELYRVNQDHTAQEQYKPGGEGTESLYTHITVTPSGWEVWQQPTGAHDAYAIGYIVLDEEDGNTYRSLVDNNVWGPPHEQPQLWELYHASEQ